MNHQPHPERKTERLHRGRISAVGARYFITLVTKARKSWLRSPEHARLAIEALRAWHERDDGRILAATVMPDHVHVLLELGKGLGVGACVGCWKSHVLKKAGYAEDWQRDFWEHRVRNDERWEDYGLYMFLNPYRAGPIKRDESWPWWWAPEPKVFSFMLALDSRGVPPREWMDWPEDRWAGLEVGE